MADQEKRCSNCGNLEVGVSADPGCAAGCRDFMKRLVAGQTLQEDCSEWVAPA